MVSGRLRLRQRLHVVPRWERAGNGKEMVRAIGLAGWPLPVLAAAQWTPGRRLSGLLGLQEHAESASVSLESLSYGDDRARAPGLPIWRGEGACPGGEAGTLWELEGRCSGDLACWEHLIS